MSLIMYFKTDAFNVGHIIHNMAENTVAFVLYTLICLFKRLKSIDQRP